MPESNPYGLAMISLLEMGSLRGLGANKEKKELHAQSDGEH